jgi:hypothetical protein
LEDCFRLKIILLIFGPNAYVDSSSLVMAIASSQESNVFQRNIDHGNMHLDVYLMTVRVMSMLYQAALQRDIIVFGFKEFAARFATHSQ